MAKKHDTTDQTNTSTTQPEELQHTLAADAAETTPAAPVTDATAASPAAHAEDATATQPLNERAPYAASAADAPSGVSAEAQAEAEHTDEKPAFLRRKWVMITAPIVAGVLLLSIGGSVGYAIGDGPGGRGGDRSSQFAQGGESFEGRGGFGGQGSEEGFGGRGGHGGGMRGDQQLGGPESGALGGDSSRGQTAPDTQLPQRPGQNESGTDSNSGQSGSEEGQTDRSTRGNTESNTDGSAGGSDSSTRGNSSSSAAFAS